MVLIKVFEESFTAERHWMVLNELEREGENCQEAPPENLNCLIAAENIKFAWVHSNPLSTAIRTNNRLSFDRWRSIFWIGICFSVPVENNRFAHP